MNRRRLLPFLTAAGAVASCGGVSANVRRDLPAPRTVAVLPIGGTADASVRDVVRSLTIARLREHGLQPVEPAYVDRVLAARGWLRDPAAFDPAAVPVGDAIRGLEVDALCIGAGFTESSFNLLFLRRQSFGGSLRIALADGRDWWKAEHQTSRTGGFLLQSGQVLNELRAQGTHGTPLAVLALADELVGDVAATVPPRPGDAASVAPALLRIRGPRVERQRSGVPGRDRIVVSAEAPAAARLTFDLGPVARGVPMAALGERHTGAQDVPAGTEIQGVVVRARDPFGVETTMAVQQ